MNTLQAAANTFEQTVRAYLRDESIDLEQRFRDMLEHGKPRVSQWTTFDGLPWPKMQTVPSEDRYEFHQNWFMGDYRCEVIMFDRILDQILERDDEDEGAGTEEQREADAQVWMRWCVDNYVGGVTNDW